MKYLLLYFVLSTFLFAETYYVDAANGSDSNSGTAQSTPFKTAKKATGVGLKPGDKVLFKAGESWDETLNIGSSTDGEANNYIVISSYGSGAQPILYGLNIDGSYIQIENLIIDHKKESGDCVELSRAENCVLKNLIIRNGTSDGIDLNKAHNVTIDGCTIYHFLKGSFSQQEDAHGIVAGDTRGITIKNTIIYQVSGDSFQTDPDRDTDTPNDILIDGCHFWTGPLQKDFNSGWRAGNVPGENAIDTKMVKENWEQVDRMKITIRNTVAYGWKDGNISNMAAFNMKEKIEAVFENVRVWDCEIAFRLRGTRGNANVTIKNAVVYNCERVFRCEDNVSDLKLYNSTLGSGLKEFFKLVSGKDQKGWELYNNAFYKTLPAEAKDASNKSFTDSDIKDISKDDYHLTATSTLVDMGKTISSVKTDYDGLKRPQGSAYDVGAYELKDNTTGLGKENRHSIKGFTLFQNWPNPFNPVTTIRIELSKSASGKLTVYNARGQIVRVLYKGALPSGVHTFKWDGKDFLNNDVASGIYVYAFTNGYAQQTKKMFLLK